MAFSFGRKLSSFLSDLTPTTFKSSLGPLETPQTQGAFFETPTWSPAIQFYGQGHGASTRQAGNYDVAVPAPGPVSDLRVIPEVSFRPSLKEYWNTPLGDTQLTRADHLRRIGSALRDPPEGALGAMSFPDFPPPARSGSAQGGGIGGVGGAGRRRITRDWL